MLYAIAMGQIKLDSSILSYLNFSSVSVRLEYSVLGLQKAYENQLTGECV